MTSSAPSGSVSVNCTVRTPPHMASRYRCVGWLMSATSGSHSLLTSDIFLCNLLILLMRGIKKALHRPFRSDVWIQSQTLVCFSLWSGWFCASVPAVSGREPRSRSGQRRSVCVLRRWSRGLAWHSAHMYPCGEGSRPAKRSVPFGCGPGSSGGRACSNACAGAADSRTPYNKIAI